MANNRIKLDSPEVFAAAFERIQQHEQSVAAALVEVNELFHQNQEQFLKILDSQKDVSTIILDEISKLKAHSADQQLQIEHLHEILQQVTTKQELSLPSNKGLIEE